MKRIDKFKGPSVTRRTFIAGAAMVPVAAIQGVTQPVTQTAARVSVFSAEQGRILSAFVDRLIPKDKLGPSATECGVPEYIDGSLGDFLAGEKPSFLTGLTALDEFAHKSQGAAFADLS